MRLTALVLIAACLAPSAVLARGGACERGLHPAVTAELFFGGDTGEGYAPVSDADWRAFVGAEVSPRFPDSLTAADVYGRGPAPQGAFVREQSKALFLVLGRGDDQDKLQAIRAAYRDRFHQDAVMLVEQSSCVAF